MKEKYIEVGCAIIVKKNKILISQRKPEVFLGNYWEFPGGKQHQDETIEQCLIREVDEELGVGIMPRKLLKKSHHVYPEKKVALNFYICDWVSGNPTRKDCQDFKWVLPEELKNYQFPEGDEELIQLIVLLKEDLFFGQTGI